MYLAGDIIDGWRIATAKWYWPCAHNQVIRQILRKSEKDNTRVTYVTGNHDAFLRDYIAEHNFQMGNVAVIDEAIHTARKGKKLWIVHGAGYDGVTRHHRWVVLLGDAGYNFLVWSNRWVNLLRRILKLPYWSSRAIKNKVKSAVSFIFEFERTVVREALRREMDGVVCGQIHHAGKKVLNGIMYYNCGDGWKAALHWWKMKMATFRSFTGGMLSTRPTMSSARRTSRQGCGERQDSAAMNIGCIKKPRSARFFYSSQANTFAGFAH